MLPTPDSGSALSFLRHLLLTVSVTMTFALAAPAWTSAGLPESAPDEPQVPATANTVVVLGDSITKGVRTGVEADEIFSARLEAALRKYGLNVVVNNQGIGGERTDQALGRLSKDILSQKPVLVVVMYGTNDSYVDIGKTDSRISADEFEANLREIVRQLQSQETKVILMTEPRWGDNAGKNGAGEHPNLRLERYLERTRMVAESEKLPLIDHYQLWSEARSRGENISQWMTDECHPNPEGHRQLTESMLPVIQKTLMDLPARFEPTSSNPIFTAAEGKWDSRIRERGWILREDGLWKLWYTGYQADSSPMMMKLGYATSKDGIHWERAGSEPLIGDFWVEDMMIVKKDNTYFMFAEGAQDQAQLLKSMDGVVWERVGTLDVRLKNGQPIPPGPYGTPVGYFENGQWYLFYERRDLGVWLATSTDMKVWTNISDDPVIPRDESGVDSVMMALNQIIKVGDEYVAVLHGTVDPMKPRRWCTYLARSKDLIHWKKEAPLRPVEENKSSGQLIHDGNQWLLYTMHDRVDLHTPVSESQDSPK